MNMNIQVQGEAYSHMVGSPIEVHNPDDLVTLVSSAPGSVKVGNGDGDGVESGIWGGVTLPVSSAVTYNYLTALTGTT